jgi:hypothetical protein
MEASPANSRALFDSSCEPGAERAALAARDQHRQRRAHERRGRNEEEQQQDDARDLMQLDQIAALIAHVPRAREIAPCRRQRPGATRREEPVVACDAERVGQEIVGDF